MKKMTLLEMVQNIASALETDEINSITDTTESLQIAEVVKETFYEQFNNIYVPELQGLFTFESVSSIVSPNYLKVPDNISKVQWVRYKDFRSDDRMTLIPYVHPDDFLDTQLQYNSLTTEATLTTDPVSGVQYYVRNNTPPSMFTMFDDKYVVFDQFDLDYETTMEGSNSIGYGTKVFEFLMEDDYVPPLDGNLFPLLLAESKAVCFINLKQVASAKEEQRARRQRIRMQNDQFHSKQAQTDYWNRSPNYGRRR